MDTGFLDVSYARLQDVFTRIALYIYRSHKDNAALLSNYRTQLLCHSTKLDTIIAHIHSCDPRNDAAIIVLQHNAMLIMDKVLPIINNFDAFSTNFSDIISAFKFAYFDKLVATFSHIITFIDCVVEWNPVLLAYLHNDHRVPLSFTPHTGGITQTIHMQISINILNIDASIKDLDYFRLMILAVYDQLIPNTKDRAALLEKLNYLKQKYIVFYNDSIALIHLFRTTMFTAIRLSKCPNTDYITRELIIASSM
jgi:hypothetical protein